MDNHELEELRTFARQPDGTFTIHSDMLIGDVVMAFPKAASIMLSFGLHCVGCYANVFDTIESGARGHGMTNEEITQMINEINTTINKKIDLLELTPRAIAKAKALRSQEQGKEHWPLRVKILSQSKTGFNYEMDFSPEKEGDNILEFDGLQVLIDQETLILLRGSSIDYSDEGNGFKIDNPNAPQEGHES